MRRIASSYQRLGIPTRESSWDEGAYMLSYFGFPQKQTLRQNLSASSLCGRWSQEALVGKSYKKPVEGTLLHSILTSAPEKQWEVMTHMLQILPMR